MIQIDLTLSNDGADAARAEIRSFLKHQTKKMTTELADRSGKATLGYVVLRGILGRIEQELDRIRQLEQAAKLAQREERAPKTREGWE